MATSSKKYDRNYKKENVLEQGTRNSIYQLIKENEGLHFRKICRMLDKKMGVVQYHVSVLEKNGLIRSIRDGRYKCFFASDQKRDSNISPDDRDPVAEALRENIITSLRRKTPQILITYLAQEETASHQDLSTVAEVSPQAITFHTQKLTSCGILESRKDGRQKFYSLSDEARQITEALVFGPRV